MARLSQDQIVFNLSKIPGWTLQGGHSIERILSFPDFKSAIQFVNQISEYAEMANHHPEIIINYNQVILRLTTHDKNGLTGRDFALAQRINQVKPHNKKI